jgi:hypothetical protein
MLIDAKKDKIGGLGFGSSSVKYINLKNAYWNGELWKSMKNVDFHMILPS